MASERPSLRYFVSPEGDDGASGRRPSPQTGGRDGPFATLLRARDEVRRLRRGGLPAGGVEVRLLAGTHRLGETFCLTEEDAGTPEAPILYAAEPAAEVRLTGGRDICGFEPVRDPEVLRRLDPVAASHVLCADLRSQGIEDFGRLTSRGHGRPAAPSALEVFFQDRRMPLARWPNEGWARIAEGEDPERKPGPPPPGGYEHRNSFLYEGDRPSRWTEAPDAWVHGFWRYNWADSYERVVAIDPVARRIATAQAGVYGFTTGRRYRALNLLEELDEPGEWYLDRATGILYFWPPAPPAEARAAVSLLEEPLVALCDTRHVVLEGLILECGRGNAVEITDGECCRVARCRIRNVGRNAVVVSGGSGHRVVGCEIHDTGEGGIVLEGGDRKELTRARHEAVSNHIHHFSRLCRTYTPAVRAAGVGQRIAHNLIHDAPHMAIGLAGNEHLVEFNEVHDVCTDTADVGAFYSGRDWTWRGNVVRFNFFHHIGGAREDIAQGFADAMSIYLDDFLSGFHVHGNICWQGGRAVLIGGGRDNVVENNVFIECRPAVHVDARGLGWARYYFDGGYPVLFERLASCRHTEPPYAERYPALAGILEDEPAVPKNNVIRRNVCYGGEWLDIRPTVPPGAVCVERNRTFETFDIAALRERGFQPDADTAREMGFERIPFERIGPRPADRRASPPEEA